MTDKNYNELLKEYEDKTARQQAKIDQLFEKIEEIISTMTPEERDSFISEIIDTGKVVSVKDSNNP